MNNDGVTSTGQTTTTGMPGSMPQPATGFPSVPPFGSAMPETPAVQPQQPAPFGMNTVPASPFTQPGQPVVSPIPGSAPLNAMSATPPPPAWTPPTTPSTPPVPPTPMGGSNDFKPEREAKSKLPLLIAGILLIFAMAGGYFLYVLYQTPTADVTPPVEQQVEPTATPVPTMTEEEQTQQDINKLEEVSNSDEVESLQQDIENTDLSTVDSSLTPTAQ